MVATDWDSTVLACSTCSWGEGGGGKREEVGLRLGREVGHLLKRHDSFEVVERPVSQGVIDALLAARVEVQSSEVQ